MSTLLRLGGATRELGNVSAVYIILLAIFVMYANVVFLEMQRIKLVNVSALLFFLGAIHNSSLDSKVSFLS